MRMLDHLWIIPALPLLGAALNGIFGRRWAKKAVDAVGVGSTGLSFFAALAVIREFWSLPAGHIPWVKSYFPWIVAGPLRVDFALQVDQLTVVMLLVVTGVGWLIHIYSTGYMAHEGGYYRFFSYLNLFMFFMLILVMASNFLLMFVGWEGVGLCSYLLIGFYFLRKSAADAGKKAFVVNRIGDFGFMLGMFLIYWTFESLDFATVFSRAAQMPAEGFATFEWGALTAICLLLFVGATGKSAQLPLYVWLPDAMEGPTPVSALIHAATMVTAGVYMVARSSVLFTHAPAAMTVVAVVGALTALYAATIGLVQTDIKRVLAYSTVSQLGYMFLACGVGAFAAGIFHLFTHAFFKALLFLGSGSVIHALHGEQDMRRMGGLRGKIPWTYATMLMGTLAIAGVPFFSGFFSKEAILLAAKTGPHAQPALFWVGVVAAMLTAFYMFRLLFLTFHGAPRFDEHHVHTHESPWSMLGPLVVLAALSVGGGWMAAPHLFGGTDHFADFLAPVFGGGEEAAAGHVGVAQALLHILLEPAVIVALLAFFAAWWLYIRQPQAAERLAESFHAPYRLLLNKYYVDEIYDAVVVRPMQWVSTRVLWQVVDVSGIDGSVNGLADAARAFGHRLRQMHSGNTRSYAGWVALGAFAFATFLLWLARQG
jgi:NADH-quinone oxidoreductase subunit L